MLRLISVPVLLRTCFHSVSRPARSYVAVVLATTWVPVTLAARVTRVRSPVGLNVKVARLDGWLRRVSECGEYAVVRSAPIGAWKQCVTTSQLHASTLGQPATRVLSSTRCRRNPVDAETAPWGVSHRLFFIRRTDSFNMLWGILQQ